MISEPINTLSHLTSVAPELAVSAIAPSAALRPIALGSRLSSVEAPYARGPGALKMFLSAAPFGLLGATASIEGGVLSKPMVLATRRVAYVRVAPALRETRRGREMDFVRDHPEVFDGLVGQWIVLEGQTIIAHGDDPAQIASEARTKGVRVPFLFRVERKRSKDEGTIGL